MGNRLTGDVGDSYATRQDVLPLVMARLRNTLLMAVPVLVMSTIAGVALGRLGGGQPPAHAGQCAVVDLDRADFAAGPPGGAWC